MVFSFNQLTKIEQNNVLLPELDLTVDKGDIIAIQTENEYIQRLFDLLNHPHRFKKGAVTLPKGGFQNVYIFQQTDGLYKRLNVRQMLRFWSKLYQYNGDIEWIVDLCELQSYVSKKTKDLTQPEQRRLQFALALIQPAAVYIFEDPSLMLDLQSKQVLHNLLVHLAKNGGAVLLFTPALEEAIRLGNIVYRYSERGVQKVEEDGEDTEEEHEEDVTSTQVQFEKISAKVEDKIILFHPLEIDYIEVRNAQTFLYVNNEEFVSSNTIKTLEARLLPLGFFRCHRSYLVNLQRVREIIIWSKNSYSLSLDNSSKSKIPLSKGNYSKLKELIQL
ncbi:transcriptional regulator [Bacillus sp. J14TS2]|uniref:LytTR family transcriptional regulator DNA-binding domain-containing protein n=1 Tax=Bacillus sp. J14TS2 TaxID=2807188 RepID=UPI001B111EFA|nr:LytTR family transcriptional regulator DNA-binding domain-containing protein [Bacillus sp. J14TS2]GIN74819.1 transcriptional regulator [Bacillus sp. J14TS2]